jgi:signal transduction histidine kinase
MTDEAVARVIHDLRTPLTSVLSLSEILHDYPNLNGKKKREFLDIIIREAKRMTGIIKRVEMPGRPASNTITPMQTIFQNIDKGGVVDECDQKQRLERNHGRAGDQSCPGNTVHLEYF